MCNSRTVHLIFGQDLAFDVTSSPEDVRAEMQLKILNDRCYGLGGSQSPSATKLVLSLWYQTRFSELPLQHTFRSLHIV